MAMVRVMSVVPSAYCPPEVGEIERSGFELEIAGGSGPVMDDGAMRACRGDRVEAQILELSRLAAELFELHRRADLVDPAREGILVEPCEEADDRYSVAEMRGAGALDLGRVLDRLRQNARVVSGDDLGACGLEDVREAHRRRLRVEADVGAFLSKGFQPCVERIRRQKLSRLFQMATHIVPELGGIDEQCWLAARRDQGEGKRERGVGDIAAADVEQPRDRIEQSEQDGIGLLALQGLLHLGDLLSRTTA